MKEVKNVDGLKFYLSAINKMSKEEFIAIHYHLGVKRLSLNEEKAKKWAAETFDVLTGKPKKQAESKE